MPTELIDLPQARSCHDVESDVRRELLAIDRVKLSSLVVRRMQNGICLQGVVKFADESFDICDAVRKIPGVNRILNHLVVCGANERSGDAGALADSPYTVSWEEQR